MLSRLTGGRLTGRSTSRRGSSKDRSGGGGEGGEANHGSGNPMTGRLDEERSPSRSRLFQASMKSPSNDDAIGSLIQRYDSNSKQVRPPPPLIFFF